MAVNKLIFAGFSQKLVLNHEMNPSDPEAIAEHFRSLYSELSFAEVARLTKTSREHTWFPLHQIIQKFGWVADSQFFLTAEALLKTPMGFQNWCADRKISPQELAPLLSAGSLNLKPLFKEILELKLSRSTGALALLNGIQMMLDGTDFSQISTEELLNDENSMTSLPWPGTSEARWVRQGDKTGIELTLFVSQPSDLRKHLQSLNHVQALLERDPSGTKH